eukprot:12654712-Prorocentrum_lima.AAC.1
MASKVDSCHPRACPHNSRGTGSPATTRNLAPPPPCCCNRTIAAPSPTLVYGRKSAPRAASLPATIQAPQSSPTVARNGANGRAPAEGIMPVLPPPPSIPDLNY